MITTIILDGHRIHDIPSFYQEVNRSFMHGEDWNLAESLDALDDMLYGAYGAIKGSDAVRIIWKNFQGNRKDLGVEPTRRHYVSKLEHPQLFNVGFIKKQLDDLDKGRGKTYFEIILELIAGHPNIELIEA